MREKKERLAKQKEAEDKLKKQEEEKEKEAERMKLWEEKERKMDEDPDNMSQERFAELQTAAELKKRQETCIELSGAGEKHINGIIKN